MRRGISIAMVIFGLAVVITGIWNWFPPFDTMFFPPHAISSFVFGLLAIVHIWLNWKPLVRCFKGLGRWWILVGLGYALVIYMGIIVPVFTVTGIF